MGQLRSNSDAAFILKLPLDSRIGEVLQWIVFDGATLELTLADLGKPWICDELSQPQRRRVAATIQSYLEEAIAGDSPEWAKKIQIGWDDGFLGKISRPSQLRLIKLGLVSGWTYAVSDLLPAITRLEDLIVILGLPVVKNCASGARIPLVGYTQSLRTTASSPPMKWRPDPALVATFIDATGSKFSAADPRFGWWLHLLVDSKPVADVVRVERLIEAARFSRRLAQVAQALSEGLEAAKTMSVQEEIDSIAQASARAVRNRDQATLVMRMRYGSNGDCSSLEEIGSSLGISRQSVYQQITLCKRAVFTEDAFAPALRRLFENARVDRPVTRELLGPTQSLEGALQFGSDFMGLSLGRRHYA